METEMSEGRIVTANVLIAHRTGVLSPVADRAVRLRRRAWQPLFPTGHFGRCDRRHINTTICTVMNTKCLIRNRDRPSFHDPRLQSVEWRDLVPVDRREVGTEPSAACGMADRVPCDGWLRHYVIALQNLILVKRSH
jgi:hypothetical protein